MNDVADEFAREWALIRSVGDPMAAGVIAANDPWDAYDAALDYATFLDYPELPHVGALHNAWAELTDLFETAKTDLERAHAMLNAAASAWLDRPQTPSTEWIENWISAVTQATSAQFRLDGDFWRTPSK